MKHHTPQLLKFQRLQRRLGESKRGLVGLLELLWHGTATQAPDGDIGRYTNEEIAILVDWDGDHDQLVAALVETGWLDESEQHRLVVHDWSDHQPNWIRLNSKRKSSKKVPQERTYEASYEATYEATYEASCEASYEQTPNLTIPNLTKPNQTQPQERRSAADVCLVGELFQKPTQDQVAALAEAESLDVDAATWCEYYEARGWQMGKNAMRDWRAAVRAAARRGWCRKPAASKPRKRMDPVAAQIAAEYVRRKQAKPDDSS